MQEIYEIDTSNKKSAIPAEEILAGRKNFADANDNGMDSDVTILIQAYNRLEKTKECVSSVLKYTTDVNYDLLLVDNGSTDDTFEYFKAIDYPKKRIIHITKNVSAVYPNFCFDLSWIAKYYVCLANDIVVTPQWLSNMVKVAESDDRIGMVNPVGSNMSNLQQVNLQFNSLDEMEAEAGKFNVSDHTRWQERLRLITLGTLYKKECLYAIGWPISDVGFYHDFGDDDITFRVRRAGYKAILAGDTWIHHNHDFRHSEDRDPEEFNRSLKIGRQNFKDKYFGIDAWDDVNNFIPEYLNVLKPANSQTKSILGVDVRCGTPILEIKNRLRLYNIFDADCYAFTRLGKYFIDLQTVCGADRVHTGSIDRVKDCFEENSLDYIVIGEDINSYPEPLKLIQVAYRLLKSGGQLFVSLKNVYDIFTFLNIIGNGRNNDLPHVINYSLEQFMNALLQNGFNTQYITARQYNLLPEAQKYVNDCMSQLAGDGAQESAFRLMVDRYFFVINKPQ